MLDAVQKYAVSPEHAAKCGALPIQSHSGRMKPINTFSSEILRTLPVGIISTDMDDRITSINPAAQDITGLTRTAATGRGLHDLLPGVWAVLVGRTAQDAAREQEAWCTVGERRVPLAISASAACFSPSGSNQLLVTLT